MQLQWHSLHLTEESETVAGSTAIARDAILWDSARQRCGQTCLAGCPHCAACQRWSVYELSPLAGLRFGDEALFATGRARTFGSDNTPDRERHAHHRVITPAVARPYISPGQVTDQGTGSTLTGVVVFMAEWSYTKRYVTDALAALHGGKLVALANSDPIGETPIALTDTETVPRVAALGPPSPQTPRFARPVEALDVQVLVPGAIAVPGRCTCIDSHPQRV